MLLHKVYLCTTGISTKAPACMVRPCRFLCAVWALMQVLTQGGDRTGPSTVRKVEIATGKVLQKSDLEDKYFGEGMELWDGK